MSVPPDPTEPTLAARPAPPVARRGTGAYVATDATLWVDLRARLRSLTSAVTIALIVAVVALGVALWALLGGTDDDTGASPARVSMLDQRVERLESATRRGAWRDELSAVRQQQRVLAERLAALSNTIEQPTDDVDSLRTAIDATQQAVDQLNQRLIALEQGASPP
jgi:hypothetical protein